MANFCIFSDPDPKSRKRFHRWLRGNIRVHRQMRVDSVSAGDVSIVYARVRSTPIVVSSTGQSCAVCLGDSDFTAEGLAAIAAQDLADGLPLRDGFHVLAAGGGSEGRAWISVGGDIDGLFPIYYWSDSKRCIIASSPALILGHPACPRRWSAEGVTKLLTLGGLEVGSSLWEKIQIPEFRHSVHWETGAPAREVPFPRMPEIWSRSQLQAMGPSAALDILHEESVAAMQRSLARSSGKLTAMLSGGLDSRTMFAVAVETQATVANVVCFGETEDIEMRCALSVAEAYGIPFHPCPVPEKAFKFGMKQNLRWEHLTNGAPNACWMWFAARELARHGERYVGGLLLDACLTLSKSNSGAKTDLSYCFHRNLACGLYLDEFQRLWGPHDPSKHLESLHQSIQHEWESDCVQPYSHPFLRHIMRYRGRHQTAAALWITAQYLWPVLPITDVRWKSLIEAMPPEFLEGRQLHESWLVQKFPKLAALPVDKTHHTPRYLVERDQVPLPTLPEKRARRKPAGPNDTEFYRRLYTLHPDSPWEKLRVRISKPGGMGEALNAVQAWAEASRTDTPAGSSIVRAHPIKNVIALDQWYRQYRPAFPAKLKRRDPAVWNPWILRPIPPSPFVQQNGCIVDFPGQITSRGITRAEWEFACHGLRTRVFYEFDNPKEKNVFVSNAAFAPALVMAMNGQMGRLRLYGTVDPVQLENGGPLQAYFTKVHPTSATVAVETTGGVSAAASPREKPRTLAFLTGGVDSCYSVMSLRDSLDALVLVHGFDVRLDDGELWDATFKNVAALAADVGLPLHVVRTNLRDTTEKFAPWGTRMFGAGLASTAHLLSGIFSKAVIAASYDPETLAPAGSMPMLDPLFSGSRMQIVHHGDTHSRTEKLMALKNWDYALRSLRVCWQNPEAHGNCGECEKCHRTLACLEIAGLTGRAETLPPLDYEKLAARKTEDPLVISHWLQISKEIDRYGGSKELRSAVDSLLANSALVLP